MQHSPNEEIFRERYTELFDYLYRYTVSRIPNRADAEDIAATVLTTAYEHLARYDARKGNLEQYVTGIARFKIIDYWRTQRVSNVDMSSIADLLPASGAVSAADALDAQITFNRVVDRLSPELRALFILRYIDGLTYDDIAQQTQRKATTIRKLFSDAHKQLRKVFHVYR